jgi:hypothetical protein
MPLLSCIAIRTALLALLVGAAVGAWTLAAPAFGRQPPWALLPLHVELLLFGWLVQLTMGVAYWILPRTPGRPKERGRVPFAIAALLLLNAGLLLAGLGPTFGVGAMLVLGRTLELLAVLCFALHAWPRVRLVVAA